MAAAMTVLHAVKLGHGSGWDQSQPLEGQPLWPEHADFMDAMMEEGMIVLGGPIGDGDHVLLIFDAEPEQIRARLAADPWHQRDMLFIEQIEPWLIRLDSR
jgi:uncharacterized protein YciI